MTAYFDIAPEPHRLVVGRWNDTFHCHECVVEGGTAMALVDLFVDGTLPEDIGPDDLIGRTVEVGYTHGFVWLAQGPRLVSAPEMASKRSTAEPSAIADEVVA